MLGFRDFMLIAVPLHGEIMTMMGLWIFFWQEESSLIKSGITWKVDYSPISMLDYPWGTPALWHGEISTTMDISTCSSQVILAPFQLPKFGATLVMEHSPTSTLDCPASCSA